MQQKIVSAIRIFFIVVSLFLPPNVQLMASNANAVGLYLTELIFINQLMDPTGDIKGILKFLETVSPGELENDFLQLQPSWYSALDWSTENTLTNASKIISNNILARVREYRCAPVWQPPVRGNPCNRHSCLHPEPCVPNANFWVGGTGGHLQQDKLQQLPAFRSNDWGLISGFDFVLANWLSLGIAGGYTHSNLNWDNLKGPNSIQTFYIGPYFVWTCGRWCVEGSILKGAQRYRSDRHILFSFVNRKARNTHYGDSVLCHLGSTLNYYCGDYAFAPYLMADYVYLHVNGIKEKGAHLLDLKVRAHSTQFFQGEIGAAFCGTFKSHLATIVPTVKTGIQNITPIEGTKLRARLRGQPGSFIVKTSKEPIYQWTTGLFVNFYVPDLPEFSVSYNGAWGNKRREYYFSGEIDWCF
jgi:hypothetical protein